VLLFFTYYNYLEAKRNEMSEHDERQSSTSSVPKIRKRLGSESPEPQHLPTFETECSAMGELKIRSNLLEVILLFNPAVRYADHRSAHSLTGEQPEGIGYHNKTYVTFEIWVDYQGLLVRTLSLREPHRAVEVV